MARERWQVRMVRAALTETRNAFDGMPSKLAGLPSLENALDDIRRANVDHNIELIRSASAAGVRIVGLGELFPAPYFALSREPFWRDLAEDAVDGETVTALRDVARVEGVVLVAPIYEIDGDRRFNTAVVIDADGVILGKYRKSHIPEGANELHSFDEKFYYEPSDLDPLLPVFDTAVGRIGVAICYDRHFEGVISGLARSGAHIVFSPAVTFGEKSRRLWESEFAIEAARHNVFIGGSNRRGSEPPWNQEFFGDSHFVGPIGRQADRSDAPNLVISDLDLDVLERPDPSGWDLARDARPLG